MSLLSFKQKLHYAKTERERERERESKNYIGFLIMTISSILKEHPLVFCALDPICCYHQSLYATTHLSISYWVQYIGHIEIMNPNLAHLKNIWSFLFNYYYLFILGRLQLNQLNIFIIFSRLNYDYLPVYHGYRYQTS